MIWFQCILEWCILAKCPNSINAQWSCFDWVTAWWRFHLYPMLNFVDVCCRRPHTLAAAVLVSPINPRGWNVVLILYVSRPFKPLAQPLIQQIPWSLRSEMHMTLSQIHVSFASCFSFEVKSLQSAINSMMESSSRRWRYGAHVFSINMQPSSATSFARICGIQLALRYVIWIIGIKMTHVTNPDASWDASITVMMSLAMISSQQSVCTE